MAPKFTPVALVAFIVTILIFTGCGADSQKTTQIGKLSLELLGEYEGMKIYRVRDGDARVFYVTDQRGCVSFEQKMGKYSVPRVIMNSGNTTFKQEDDEVIMEVRFKFQPILERE